MSSRREALKRLTQLSALGLAAPTIARGLLAQPVAPDAGLPSGAGAMVNRCGVQLYTVRGEMQKSVEATLARVASIGYKEVEFAGYFGRTPKQVADALKANGLTAPSTHISLGELAGNTSKVLDVMGAIGHKYAVVPSLDASDRGALDEYRRIADQFNALGAVTKQRGIQFAYHNHDFEFASIDGGVPYDVLLSRCDRALVMFEMDLYWINKAGRNPMDYFARYQGRFPLVHVKDMKRDGTMTEVGAGTLPFAKYVSKGPQAGIVHYFVEHDNPADPFASIAASYKALSAL